jgi:phosphotransferase family enzyme
VLRQPLENELAAATAIALKAGMGPVTPEVLHLGNHTTAKLKPWLVVARIASGTSFDLESASIERELTIAAHLATRHAPSVRPTTKVPAGPYFEKGCAVTLWEFVEGRAVTNEADERMAAASLQEIHSALADISVDLPSFLAKVDSCNAILANGNEAPKLSSNDRIFLQNVYGRLRTDLSSVGGSWQPLHGDAHVGNAMVVNSGAIWMDLESVCVGPLEWDVGFLPIATWSDFPRIDAALIRLLADVRSCCVAVWCWAEFDRSAASKDAAIYHLDQLKRRFS